MPTKFYNLDVDTTLGGNSPSDNIVPSQKAIKTYVDNNSGGGTVAIDGTTITKNSSDQIQAIAVIDQNAGIAKAWTGTQAEYDAIVTKDPETEYIITDDIGGPATVIAELAEAVNDKVDKGHQVIEFQEPTAANNYTWYRKYADGWVEQGGQITGLAAAVNSWNTSQVTLPVTMADTNYSAIANDCGPGGSYYHGTVISTKTTTTFTYWYYNASSDVVISWEVKGMVA